MSVTFSLSSNKHYSTPNPSYDPNKFENFIQKIIKT